MLVKRLALPLIAFLFVSAGVLSAEFTIRLGHLANADHTWHKACLKFKEVAEKETGGRVAIEVYPNDELGKELEVVNMIHGGLAEMVISSDSLANYAPTLTIIAVPYMVRDMDHLAKVLQSNVADIIKKELIEKAGLRPMSTFMRNPRNLTSNRAISTPSDLNGLKLRISNVPIHVAVWEELGAKPVPMAFSEVFTSLQQGVIEGQENPLDLIKSASFFEVQKFLNESEHQVGWIYLLIGEDYWQTLPKDVQAALEKAGREAELYERELNKVAIGEIAQFLKDKGMTFNKVDKAAFAKKAEPAIMKFLNPELQKLYQQIIAIK
ncbi:MAG: TRAP transporter substrate-binding protein [Planctomycetota bacterium]|jgi:tripartite ATP-independent transporter DctP family solute receptor|nr:TRAP transporter substrate-binding protein [Planctomycetota bacterium]